MCEQRIKELERENAILLERENAKLCDARLAFEQPRSAVQLAAQASTRAGLVRCAEAATTAPACLTAAHQEAYRQRHEAAPPSGQLFTQPTHQLPPSPLEREQEEQRMRQQSVVVAPPPPSPPPPPPAQQSLERTEAQAAAQLAAVAAVRHAHRTQAQVQAQVRAQAQAERQARTQPLASARGQARANAQGSQRRRSSTPQPQQPQQPPQPQRRRASTPQPHSQPQPLLARPTTVAHPAVSRPPVCVAAVPVPVAAAAAHANPAFAAPASVKPATLAVAALPYQSREAGFASKRAVAAVAGGEVQAAREPLSALAGANNNGAIVSAAAAAPPSSVEMGAPSAAQAAPRTVGLAAPGCDVYHDAPSSPPPPDRTATLGTHSTAASPSRLLYTHAPANALQLEAVRVQAASHARVRASARHASSALGQSLKTRPSPLTAGAASCKSDDAGGKGGGVAGGKAGAVGGKAGAVGGRATLATLSKNTAAAPACGKAPLSEGSVQRLISACTHWQSAQPLTDLG